ncbi:NRDE family protein [Chryseobacterium aureum]|uniref:NRDE family protein n=1 Tax=Chryseobacterium aureum TaxID=2497456 RepID=UPI000F88F874|nr:NRDE family protein [Chryseobacterium aureum]
MCTVSFFKTEQEIILTSNRDEKINRERAVFPNSLDLQNKKLYFPKDERASGTWFITDDNGNTVILLNGAFRKHLSNPPYKKSRGIVLLDLAKSENFLKGFHEYNLSGIEPFQLLVCTEEKLFRLLWDGNSKHMIPLNKNENHLFSSKTLYDDSIEYQRNTHFKEFQKHNKIDAEKIVNFHKMHQIEKEDEIESVIKETFITVSITQLIIRKENIDLRYYDLVENTLQKKKIEKRIFI